MILFRCRENSRGRYALVSILDEWGKGRSVAINAGSESSGWTNVRYGILEVGGLKGGLSKGKPGLKEALLSEDIGASGT